MVATLHVRRIAINIRWGTFLAGFLGWLPAVCAVLFLAVMANAQDVVGSKDPAGVKRYEGSELIGYRAPKFDEYLLPLGTPTSMAPPVYAESKQIEGLVSYYTYLAPKGRMPTELFRNYKQEFQSAATRPASSVRILP